MLGYSPSDLVALVSTAYEIACKECLNIDWTVLSREQPGKSNFDSREYLLMGSTDIVGVKAKE